MRRAVGTRGGLEDGCPTVGAVGWDKASRCDAGGGRVRRGFGLFVIGYQGAMRFLILDTRSSSDGLTSDDC